MRILIVLILIFQYQSLLSQTDFDRTHSDQKFSYYFSIYEKSEDVQCLNEPIYYWFDNQEIGKNQGGFQGDLLHGKYQAINRDNKLIHQGDFKKGLKSGLWKNWSVNGNLVSVKSFKNGVLNGKVRIYREESGKLKSIERYRNGLKHGRQEEFLMDGTLRKSHYKNGQEKVAKEKKEKFKKHKPEKAKKEKIKKEKVEKKKEKT